MTIIINNYDWVIDYETLRYDVNSWCDFHGFTKRELSELVDTTSLGYVIGSNQYDKKGSHISMGSLLKVCNLCELDPRKYFVLQISKEG